MTEESSILKVLDGGMGWPSGDYSEIAVIDIGAPQLRILLGKDLMCGHEDGLGEWQAIGLQLSSGAMIELIAYLHEPLRGFTLRTDSRANGRAVVEETVAALGATKDKVLWVNPSI